MAGIQSGAVVGRFRILSVIGEGATGTVYLAEDAGSGKHVALKVLSPELARDERFRRRFLRETEVAARLDHPNVVPTIASGEADGALYLAMPYLDGADLRELLRRESRLDADRALELIAQVAAALDAAHAAGLVHRDVKPANILVGSKTDGEQAQICDFGLARYLSSVSSLTGDRGFVGTVDYVPPEQIEGARIDGRADVYSLGCVLYECLAGSRPFDRESELSVVFAHLNEPPPRITDTRPGLPQDFDLVFETVLAKSPDDRYSTCGELVAAARAALRGTTFARRKTKRRRVVMAAAAALAAGGAAIVGLLASETRGAHVAPVITRDSIDGAKLNFTAPHYEKLLGGYRASTLTEFSNGHFRALSFQQPQVGVYFAPGKKRASIITTWNKNSRTAAGIGPCSTIAEMKRAYGDSVRPSLNGTQGKTVWSWVVGDRLLFATQDHKTIADVALFRGSPTGDRNQGWPNYIAAIETACK